MRRIRLSRLVLVLVLLASACANQSPIETAQNSAQTTPDSLSHVDTAESAAGPAPKQEFGPLPGWLETACAGRFAATVDLEEVLPEYLHEASADFADYRDKLAPLSDALNEGSLTEALSEVALPAPDDPMSALVRLRDTDCDEGSAGYYAATEQALLAPLSQGELEEQVKVLLKTTLEEMFDRVRVRGPGLGSPMPVGVADLKNSTFLGLYDGKEYAYDGSQTFTKVDGVWESSSSDSLRGSWWFPAGIAAEPEAFESAVISFVGDEYRLGVPTRHVKVELGDWYIAHVWIDEFGQPRRFESTVPLFDIYLWASTDFLELNPDPAAFSLEEAPVPPTTVDPDETVDAYVVVSDIASDERGDFVVRTSIELQPVPIKDLPDDRIVDLTQVIGRVAATDILAGSVLVDGMFVDPVVD